jgi:cell division protein FtsL
MTQAAHAIAHNIQQALRYRERIAILLIGIIAVSAFAYIFYVREAVLNVVAREQVAAEIQTDNTTVSNLENQYFNLKSAITMDVATADGFEPAKVSAFISADDSDGTGLAYNEIEQ